MLEARAFIGIPHSRLSPNLCRDEAEWQGLARKVCRFERCKERVSKSDVQSQHERAEKRETAKVGRKTEKLKLVIHREIEWPTKYRVIEVKSTTCSRPRSEQLHSMQGATLAKSIESGSPDASPTFFAFLSKALKIRVIKTIGSPASADQRQANFSESAPSPSFWSTGCKAATIVHSSTPFSVQGRCSWRLATAFGLDTALRRTSSFAPASIARVAVIARSHLFALGMKFGVLIKRNERRRMSAAEDVAAVTAMMTALEERKGPIAERCATDEAGSIGRPVRTLRRACHQWERSLNGRIQREDCRFSRSFGKSGDFGGGWV